MAELAPFQKQTLAIKGKDPLKTYSLRLGYLNYVLDKAGIDSDQDRQKLIETTLGQKPEDVDMSDTVWGEVKRRVHSGSLQLYATVKKFGQFANAFGDPDWEDIEDYEKQITSLEKRAQSVPKMRDGYLYDVVEQVPNTLSTLGITLGVSAVTGGFAFPALASYGINIVFESGESFNAKLRDQKIDEAFARRWKGRIPEAEYRENLREAKKEAALSAGTTQIVLEAVNPFNAVEALPMGKIGSNVVGKLAKTTTAKYGPTRALRAKIQDSPRLSKAIGMGGEVVARSASEFGQELTQNIKSDVIQQVVGTDKGVGEALTDVDYGSAGYGALVGAGSAGGVTTVTNVGKRIAFGEAPNISESELIRQRVREAIESGNADKLNEELSVLRQEVAEEEALNREQKKSFSEGRDNLRIKLMPEFLNKRQKLKKQLQIAEEEIQDIAAGRETDSRVDKDRTRFELRKGLVQAVQNGSQKEVDQWLGANSDNPNAQTIIDDFVKDVEGSQRYSLRDVFRARDLGVQPDTRPPVGPQPEVIETPQEEAPTVTQPETTEDRPTLREQVEATRERKRLEAKTLLEETIARMDAMSDEMSEADVNVRNQLDASLRQLEEIEAQKEAERRVDPERQTTEEALEDARRPEPRRTEEAIDIMPMGVRKIGENKDGEDLFEDDSGTRYRVGVDKEGNIQHFREPDPSGFEESEITDKSLDRRRRKRTQEIERYATAQESAEQRGEPTMIETIMGGRRPTTPPLEAEGRGTGEAEITDEARQLVEGTQEPVATDEEASTDTTEQAEEEKPTLTVNSATEKIMKAPELEGVFENKSQALKRLRDEIKKGESGVVTQIGKSGKTLRKSDIQSLIQVIASERPQEEVQTEAEIEQQVDEQPVEETQDETVAETTEQPEEQPAEQPPSAPEESVAVIEQAPQSDQALADEINEYVVENYSDIYSHEPVFSGEGKTRTLKGVNIFRREKKKGRKTEDKVIERRFSREELEQVGAIGKSGKLFEQYGEYFDTSGLNKLEQQGQDGTTESETDIGTTGQPVPEATDIQEEVGQPVPEDVAETNIVAESPQEEIVEEAPQPVEVTTQQEAPQPVRIQPPEDAQARLTPLFDGETPVHPAFGKSENRKALSAQAQKTVATLKNDPDFDINLPDDLTGMALVPFKEGNKTSFLIYPKATAPFSPELQQDFDSRTEANPVTPQELAKNKIKLRTKESVSPPIRKISSDVAERLVEIADVAGVKLGEYKPIMSEEVATAFKEINEKFGDGADAKYTVYEGTEYTEGETSVDSPTIPLSRVVADLNRRGRVVTNEQEDSGQAIPYKTTLYMPPSGRGNAEIDVVGKQTKNGPTVMYTVVVPVKEAEKIFYELTQKDESGGRAKKWRASVVELPSWDTLSSGTSQAKQEREGTITGSGTTTIDDRLRTGKEIGSRASGGFMGATSDFANSVYDLEYEEHLRKMGPDYLDSDPLDVKSINERIRKANEAGREAVDRDFDMFLVGLQGKEINLKPPKSGDIMKWLKKNKSKIDKLKKDLSERKVVDRTGNEASHLDVLKAMHKMTDRGFWLQDKARRRKAEAIANANKVAEEVQNEQTPKSNEEELKALLDQTSDIALINDQGDVRNPESSEEADAMEAEGFWNSENETEAEITEHVAQGQTRLHNSIAPEDEVGVGMEQNELVREVSLIGGNQPIPVITHANPQTASEAVGIDIRDDARGFALNDEIHLIASNIRNPQTGLRTIFHEGVGHIGIERMLGEKAYNELLDSVVRTRMADVKSMAEARGFMKNGVHINQPRIKSLKDAYYEGARELVATAAEPFADMKDSVLKRVMRTVGDFLQRIFGGRYSDAYLRSLMSQVNHHFKYGKTNEVMAMDLNREVQPDPLPSVENGFDRAGIPAETEVSYSTLPSDRQSRVLSDEEEAQMNHLSEDAKDIIRRTGGGEARTEPRNFLEKLKEDFTTKLRQGMFDRYNSLQGLGRRFYVLARMTHSNDSAMNSALEMGKLKWMTKDGKFDGLGNDNQGGFFQELGQKIGAEMYPFFRYVAVLRAKNLKGVYSVSQQLVDTVNSAKGVPQATRDAVESLIGEEFTDKQLLKQALMEAGATFRFDTDGNPIISYGNKISQWAEEKPNRERLFSDSDIATLEAELTQGVMADGRSRADAYKEAEQLLSDWNKSFVDIAQKSNLISEEEAKLWTKDPYIPFYRVIDENAGKTGYAGPQTIDGLARQTASQRLKGADIPINDLLTNMLMNWNHLLSASLKNQAALEAIDAMKLHHTGIAPTAEAISQTQADADSDTSTWIRRNGKKENYRINDPMMYESMNAMYTVSNTPTSKVMRKFKAWLTWGATVDPAFKIANLIRDTVTSAAVGNVNYGVLDVLYGNVGRGFKALKEGSDLRAQIEAGGGTINFGYSYDKDAALKLIEKGLSRENILDTPSSRKKFLRKLDRWVGSNSKPYSLYRDLGNKLENVNRAASYMKTLEETGSHLEASFEARDLMDFSNHGAHGAIRWLTDAVPFLNARLQGLYKLGRSTTDPRRKGQFKLVAGTYIMADMVLHALFKEDEEYDSREEWDRATYHWIKLGDETAFRIPKSFELGAMSTIATRVYDMIYSGLGKEERKLFMKSIVHAGTQTFAFNPIPQAIRPLVEIGFNKNFFTGRAIEPQFQRGRRRTQDIGRVYTSPTAKEVASLISMPRDSMRSIGVDWDNIALSAPQIEHLVQGYFGWAGWFVNAGVDMIHRKATDTPETPAWNANDIVLVKRFVQQFPTGQSRYKTQFYENMNELQKVFTAFKEMREDGDMENAREFFNDNKSNLQKRRTYMKVKNSLDKIRNRRQLIFSNKRMSADQKKMREDRLNERETALLRRLMTNPRMQLE